MSLFRTGPALGGLVLAVVLLAGCGSDPGNEAAGDGKISVVASTNVWGSIAQAVGGDAVRVQSLINDASGDPHAHPDKPSDAAALADADVVVFNGGGYDEFFSKLVDTTGVDVPKIDAFELSDRGAGANEHVWYDFEAVRKVADELAQQFGKLAPADEETFLDNAETIDGRLDDLADKAAAIGEAHPGAKVVATEPIVQYLLDAAGLTDATPPEFSEAVEEETDPPLSVVAATTDLLTERQVAALINNAQTETSITGSLVDAASRSRIPVVDVTETLPEGETDYVEWMTSEVDALAGALNTT